MRVLTVNTGSSSVKLRLLDGEDTITGEHEADAPGTDVDEAALAAALDELGEADAVAHRVVHGGSRATAVRIDDAVREELQGLAALAPLHQPKALAKGKVGRVAQPLLT